VSIGSFLVNYFGLPEIAGLSAKNRGRLRFVLLGRRNDWTVSRAGLLRRFKARLSVGALRDICGGAGDSIHAAGRDTRRCGPFLPSASSTRSCFPTIFSLGVAELGPLTGNGSGVLNMAIVGGRNPARDPGLNC